MRGKGVVRLDQRSHPAAERLVTAILAVLRQVLHKTAGAVPVAKGFEREEPAQFAAVDHQPAAYCLIARIGELGLEPGIASRLGPGYADHPPDRVATEQRALRSAQHFESFQVEAVEQLAGVGADEDPVDGHAHGWIETLLDVFEADAADGDRCCARTSPNAVDHQTGSAARNIANILDCRLFQRGLIKRGDRDRYHLNAL